ncbi:MAG TPA: sigma 54-interacting transcriptional regulator [Polyangia bacterium]|nr:sigma 54-interacting transcriptional regulator [Polyangia bacterium]
MHASDLSTSEQLEALNHITYSIAASLDLDQIFATVEREARKLVLFERLSFALLDSSRANVRVVGSALDPQSAPAGTFPVPPLGTIAEAIERRRPAIWQDLERVALDPADEIHAALRKLNIRSVVSIPLTAKGEVLGTLNLGSAQPGLYGPQHVPLLQQIAAQVALAIAMTRLLNVEHRRTEQLRMLHEVAKQTVSSLDLDTIVQRVVSSVHRVFNIVHFSAFLFDEQRHELRLAAVAGRWADKLKHGWAQPIDRGVLGMAARTGAPYLAEDTARDPHYVPYPGIDSKTELAVPIVARGKVLGVLNAESPIAGAFREGDVEVLTTTGDLLASCIENANLYGEIRDFNNVLEEEVRRKTAELRELNRKLMLRERRTQKENVELKLKLAEHRRAETEIIAHSRRMREVLAVADKVAASDATVLLQGESGTGKELLAVRIHRASPRAAGPYVTIHCGALPETLLESELFGHEAGAFTGADRRKPGLCETAAMGTLFLDEVGEMSLALQSKLLRFLQEGEFYRVGGKRPLHADVRVVSATHRDLRAEVVRGRFREDLLFRLNTITLELPPLRERREDIPVLVRHFLEKFRRGKALVVSDALHEALLGYGWPGNVRELANVIERLAILTEDGELDMSFLPPYILDQKDKHASQAAVSALRDIERDHIRRALLMNRGDKTKTARELGIALKTLYNKIDRYGL